MASRVRKAVIPAAGLGTRFLPVTKAVPKEMLPVVDRPAIQYVIEEAAAAGIEDVLLISSPYKKPIEDHFDRAYELERRLRDKGKDAEADELAALSELVAVHSLRQGEPLGLGHAVALGARHVGDEPFAVMLPDDIMVDGGELLRAMISTATETGRSVVALKEFSLAEISSYGCAEVSGVEGNRATITGLVEKPKPDDAPSNLAVMGRYVFTPAIFDELSRVDPGVGGEIQLTDAMDALVRREGMYGQVFVEGRYDIGQKQDFLRATVELALEHPELGADFQLFLADLAKRRLL
ncbi:MAG: UTP--glucose-1-phosphate uridylyltransferase GalU [Acidimicrobiia bacterium]|nr:UTP--glucose-1-phosphate uridylyltransferase GalU [Acidimicrobiia bacterium]